MAAAVSCGFPAPITGQHQGQQRLVRTADVAHMRPFSAVPALKPVRRVQAVGRASPSMVVAAARTYIEHGAPRQLSVQVFPDEAGVAAALCDIVLQSALQAIAAKGCFTLAVPGGSVLKMLAGLKGAPINWSKVHLYYVNHKCVPIADAKTSTHQKARHLFLDAVGVGFVAVPAEGLTSAEIAGAYEDALRGTAADVGMPKTADGVPAFDLVLLGMGADGHVGSLYPGRPELLERERWVAAVEKGGGAPASITLTLPLMNAAKQVVVACTGAKKAPAVKQALEGGVSPLEMPAQGVQPAGEAVWLMDAPAAADLGVAKGTRALL